MPPIMRMEATILDSSGGSEDEPSQVGQVVLESRSSLGKSTRSKFNDPEFCNVRVTGPGGIVVHCSRSILRSCSDVMGRVIGTSCTAFHIARGDPEAVVLMLEYMHGRTCVLSQQLVPDVMSLAKMYNVIGLIEECKKYAEEEKEGLTRRLATASDCKENGGEVESEIWQAGEIDPTRCVCEADFVEYSSRMVEEFVAATMPKLFLLLSFSRVYGRLARLVVAWLEHDYKARQSFASKLLGQLDFDYLEEGDLKEIRSSSIVPTIPGLVQNLSRDGRARTVWPKTFRNIGRSEWAVPHSGNYFVVARGGSGSNCPGASQTGLGGKGLLVAGTFYLEFGSVLSVQIAARTSSVRGLRPGGSSSCVGIRCTKQVTVGWTKEKIHVLLIAAGGGAAGGSGSCMANGEDAEPANCVVGQSVVNRCGCPLRGMSVSPKQLQEKVLESANGQMGMPYHPQPGLAGVSYMSRDAKGTYCCSGYGQSDPSVSIYLRPSYL